MINEQTLKQEKKKHERELIIRNAVNTVKAESLAKKRKRAEFNRWMKDCGVEL